MNSLRTFSVSRFLSLFRASRRWPAVSCFFPLLASLLTLLSLVPPLAASDFLILPPFFQSGSPPLLSPLALGSPKLPSAVFLHGTPTFFLGFRVLRGLPTLLLPPVFPLPINAPFLWFVEEDFFSRSMARQSETCFCGATPDRNHLLLAPRGGGCLFLKLRRGF